jgi:hypothetical protein
MKHVQGYLTSHWTPPSGDYSPRIALVDAMVFDFCVKNELWCCEIAFQSLHKKAQNGPSTQLIGVTSCIERSKTTIKAKKHR